MNQIITLRRNQRLMDGLHTIRSHTGEDTQSGCIRIAVDMAAGRLRAGGDQAAVIVELQRLESTLTAIRAAIESLGVASNDQN